MTGIKNVLIFCSALPVLLCTGCSPLNLDERNTAQSSSSDTGGNSYQIANSARTYSNLNSIGIEWDIAGDKNHKLTCSVRYRKKGGSWKEALDLFRIDYHIPGTYFRQPDRDYNMLAGSILYLESNTLYEVELVLQDETDTLNRVENFSIKTRKEPEKSLNGRVYHVYPEGTAGLGGNEIAGMAQAVMNALPGDTYIIHRGSYDYVNIHISGSEDNYIVFTGAEGEEDEIDFFRIDINGSYLWVENLTFNCPRDDNGVLIEHWGAVRSTGSVDYHDVVILNNRFNGYHYSIFLNYRNSEAFDSPDQNKCRDWYIAKNVIVGDRTENDWMINPHPVWTYGGEGIELGEAEGCVVAFNTISYVADGISYARRNCDIYGNYIYQVADDAIETDLGYANIRILGNTLHNASSALSFQPQLCGPWYIVGNEIINRTGSPFKIYMSDRFLLANNTIVSSGRVMSRAQKLLGSVARNNLWISYGEPVCSWIFQAGSDSRFFSKSVFEPVWSEDVDYDGFDLGQRGDQIEWYPSSGPLMQYSGKITFEQMSTMLSIEEHAVIVDKDLIFKNFNLPADLGIPLPLDTDLGLKSGSNAVDAGDRLPNIHDDYTGSAPDLGARELGQDSRIAGFWPN